MIFEWDNNKNQSNLKKHGLVFEDAEIVFSGELVTFKDDRFDYGEDRFITLGKLKNFIIIVVYVYRNQNVRVISMRKANECEKSIYRKRLEKTTKNDR